MNATNPARMRDARSPRARAILQRLIIVQVVLSLTGCVMMIVDAAKTAWPLYDEVAKQWSPIPAGRGRVVIYWPAQSFGEAVKDSVFVNATVQIDDGQKIPLLTGSFIFGDLSAGEHNFKLLGAVFKNKALRGLGGVKQEVFEDLSTDIPEATTTYLRIAYKTPTNPLADWGPEDLNFSAVSPAVALQELAGTRHNYKNPRPFDDSKQSRGAAWGGESTP